MKKISLILVLILPVLAFGQVVQNIEVSKEMKAIKTYSLVEQLKVKPPSQKWNGLIIDYSQEQLATDVSLIYYMDGEVVDPSFVNSIKHEDIKSITFIKDAEAKEIYGNTKGTIAITLKPETEYEATVFDPGFEVFLATQQPKEFYSQSTLKIKNTQMVAVWNSRYHQPMQYNPAIYEVNIYYDPATGYGLDVEYTLYMFFRFMEKEHNIKLS